MKGSNKATILTLAEKCKNILASNWQGHLNTIKSDAKGSKENIYTSKVKYILKRGKPYIWVPEHELHNVNTIIDELGSFSVASPFPGPLGKLLKSVNKFPARVALTGDVVPLKDKKDAYMLSLDRKGFDILGKVRSTASKDEVGEYRWKQYRFTFKEKARDVESFCRQLVQMEEEAVKKVSSYSGLG
ncbi:hypothetical protein REPUB_Repub13aG0077200 [Reevesia pubescens]